MVDRRRINRHQGEELPSNERLLAIRSTFLAANEKTELSAHFYVRESVLSGETVDHWSQMISVTGIEGGASVRSMSATRAAEMLASGYSKTCPDSYNRITLGSFDVDAYHAFAAVISCGTNPKLTPPQSESTLIVGIVGERELYTIQWGVRGHPINRQAASGQERMGYPPPAIAAHQALPHRPGETAFRRELLG